MSSSHLYTMGAERAHARMRPSALYICVPTVCN
jgi:hypothetical protein